LENVLHYNNFSYSLVSYEGTTVDEIENAFIEAVESYLETCKNNSYIKCSFYHKIRW
jgi:predicted HicB family RNase H-like nuclease